MNSIHPQRANSKKPKEDLWLLSWADMSMVLMCFFVLIISTMTPNKQKFENIQDGMAKNKEARQGSIQQIAKKVNELIQQEDLKEDTSVVSDANGLQIEFKSQLLFASGSGDLDPKSKEVVYKVLRAVTKIGKNYHLNIEGHTDDTPMLSASNYPSNWELSAARGFSLMRSLTELGMEENRISVTAFADTKPKIPYQNLKGKDLAKARAANRRVVIFIQ